MALLDRIFRDGDVSLQKSNHVMASGMWTVIRGDFTLAQFKAGLGLGASDTAQLNELVAYYQNLSVDEQDKFFGDWTAWTILAEAGLVTRTAFAARFSMTE